jgi:hypothetical protein
MSVSVADIVRRTIRDARRLSNEGVHDWRTSREALTIMLADLENRSPDDPSLGRPRKFIALGDRAFAGRQNETRDC